MPFFPNDPRGQGLAALAQRAMGGQAPVGPDTIVDETFTRPPRTSPSVPSPPVDLPNGPPAGPPQPIPPQMPPWMQPPIQDPLSSAPPPIGQPAPIPPPQEDGQALLQVLSQMAGPIRQDMQNFQNQAQQNEADAMFGRNRPDPAEQQRLDRQRLGQQALDNQIRAIQQPQFQQQR